MAPMNHRVAQDSKATAELTRALSKVPDLGVREQAIVRADQKEPGSLADVDGRHPLGRYVWELAPALLGAAGNHLETWRHLVAKAKYHPAWAHMSLLRVALETSCLARWLLDPTKETATRVQRGVAAQLADYQERATWESTSGADKLPRRKGRTGAERVAELTAARDAAMIPSLRVMSYVDLCDHYAVAGSLGGAAVYRLASAFAHGKQWTLLLADVEVPTDGRVDEPGPREITSSDTVSVLATTCAVRTFEAAVSDYERYAGRPSQDSRLRDSLVPAGLLVAHPLRHWAKPASRPY